MNKSQNQKLQKMVEKHDAAKRANPADLSADQDLSVAVMNLMAIENNCRAYPDVATTVRDMRVQLMRGMVRGGDADFAASEQLLRAAVQYIAGGEQELERGARAAAYVAFDNAYAMYSLFWGINMELIDVRDIEKYAPNIPQ